MANSQLFDNQADPFDQGLTRFVEGVKSKEISPLEVTERCLQRIDTLQPRLQAFEFIATEQAIAQAKSIESAIAAGHSVGPLAGVPVGVKDIFTVQDMPTYNGSLHPNDNLNGPEGEVIRRLKSAGCIIIGKTKTVEYALGATGINTARGTPVNPWDSSVDRIPGGSSSGSAVAVAAGLCAFALGSDTGGSIRVPACLNGLVGHKTTKGLWPTDGVFPLSSTLDSTGALCRSVADAALLHSIVTGESLLDQPQLSALTIGHPAGYFMDELDTDVQAAFEYAMQRLRECGVKFEPIELEEAHERAKLFPDIVPAELISQLTPDGFRQAQKDMDSVTGARAEQGLSVSAADYISAINRQRVLCEIAAQKLTGLDGWITPTCPFTALPIVEATEGPLKQRALQASRNTMPFNLFGLTAITLPIQQMLPNRSAPLPVGMQLVAAANEDARLLSMAAAIEAALDPAPLVDLSGFFHE